MTISHCLRQLCRIWWALRLQSLVMQLCPKHHLTPQPAIRLCPVSGHDDSQETSSKSEPSHKEEDAHSKDEDAETYKGDAEVLSNGQAASVSHCLRQLCRIWWAMRLQSLVMQLCPKHHLTPQPAIRLCPVSGHDDSQETSSKSEPSHKEEDAHSKDEDAETDKGDAEVLSNGQAASVSHCLRQLCRIWWAMRLQSLVMQLCPKHHLTPQPAIRLCPVSGHDDSQETSSKSEPLNGPITRKCVRPFLVLAQHCRVKCNYEQHRQGVARTHSVQKAWSRFSKLNQ